MKSLSRQYLFGGLFIAFGIFQLVTGDPREFALYLTAGLGFAVNALTFEPRLQRFKQLLVVITWVLIISAGILFLYLLQFKYL